MHSIFPTFFCTIKSCIIADSRFTIIHKFILPLLAVSVLPHSNKLIRTRAGTMII